MQKYKIYFVLGCNGNVIDNIIFCKKIENFIIDLSLIDKETYSEVIIFLDKSCKMFDYIINDNNEILNIINILYKKYHIISDDTLKLIQKFIFMHKECGLYITLKLKEEMQ